MAHIVREMCCFQMGKVHRVSWTQLLIYPYEAQPGAVIYGSVLVFFVGLGTIPQTHFRHILHIHLKPLPWIVHLVVDWLLTRPVFPRLYQSSPDQHPIDAIDAELYPIIPLQVKGQPTRSIVAFLTQFHDELGNFLRHGLRMAFRAFRAILKTGKAFFSIIRPPPVESLTGYTRFPAHLTDIPYLLISLKPDLKAGKTMMAGGAKSPL